MYNKKSAKAASKYTQSVMTESGPKSKMAAKRGGDDPTKPPKKTTASDTTKPVNGGPGKRLAASDTTKSYTFQPGKKTKQYNTVDEVMRARKSGEIDRKEEVRQKVRILGPKGWKQRYGTEAPPEAVVENLPKPKKAREYVTTKSGRTFSKTPVSKQERKAKEKLIYQNYKDKKINNKQRNAQLDSLRTPTGAMINQTATSIKSGTKTAVKKVKKVCKNIGGMFGRNGCHWVGSM